MSGADEYTFDDDGYGGDYGDANGGDDDDGEEAAWETEVRLAYEEGKRIQAQNKDGALAAFKKAMEKDADKGRWTFKSHKSLYRVCLMHRAEDQMLKHYKDALNSDYKERSRADVDKLIDKISLRSSHLTAPTRKAIVEISRDYVVGKYNAEDPRVADKMWFTLTLRLAQFAVDEKNMDKLKHFIDTMYAWCGAGKDAEARRGTQLMSVYAFHIQLCTAQDEPKELRRLYQKATSIEGAVCPPKVLGVIHESGGRMFLRQRQWEPAFTALSAAFRNYDAAGDPRKLSCLQYLVVAAMLSESSMNPFDMPEAKSYQGEAEITIMTELFDVAGTSRSLLAQKQQGPQGQVHSGGKRDVKHFIAILNDPKRSQYLTRDQFLYSLIEPLIQRVRGVGLVDLVRPYTAIKLSSVAAALATTPADAEKIAGRLILEGRLQGRIDQVHGHLHLTGGGAAAAAEAEDDEDDDAPGTRALLLQQLLDSSANLRANALASLRRGN